MGLSSDEQDERQQRETLAAGCAEGFAQLTEIERLWVELVRPLGPIHSDRQLESLLPRVAELLERTGIAALVHPSERPLRPLLERCPVITGEWELDTEALTLELVGATLALPLLPVPRGTGPLERHDTDAAEDVDGERRFGLGVHVLLSQPAGLSERPDQLSIRLLDGEEFPFEEHQMRLDLTALADAVRTHLIDALSSATVLTRTSTRSQAPIAEHLLADRGVENTRAVNRLVDLYAGLEHALARGAAGGRGPDGGSVTDREATRRQRVLLESLEQVRVTVHQSATEGTLEPVRLAFRATTDHDPDGVDVLPLTYDLQFDLTEDHRGEGLLEVSTSSGRAERAVLLPHVADLWTDHIDSALRRANAIVPGVRRTQHDEVRYPNPEVGPPVPDPDLDLGRLAYEALPEMDLSDVPF